MQPKGYLLISLLLASSFLIGYREETLLGWFSAFPALGRSPVVVSPNPSDVTPDSPAGDPPAARGVVAGRALPGPSPFPALSGSAPIAVPPGQVPSLPSGHVAAPSPGVSIDMTAGSSASGATGGGPVGLAGAMDAIRNAKVQEEQHAQRNAYFEQLSKQLQELKSGNPQGAVPVPSVIPPVAAQPPAGLPLPPMIQPGAVPQNELTIPDDEEDDSDNDEPDEADAEEVDDEESSEDTDLADDVEIQVTDAPPDPAVVP